MPQGGRVSVALKWMPKNVRLRGVKDALKYLLKEEEEAEE